MSLFESRSYAKLFSTDLDELVTIEVGEYDHSFQVYRGLLCFYSDYFRSAFLGVLEESKKKSVHLEDVDASTFRIFMGWLHFGNFSDSSGKVGNDLYWHDIVKVWVFADKHLIPLLKNEAVDLVLDKIAYQVANDIFYVPPFYKLSYIYDNITPESPLRRLFIDAIVSYNSKSVVEGYCIDSWNAESLRDLSAALFDRLSVDDVGNRDINSLTTQDSCKYHDHTSDGATHGDHNETKE